MKKLVVVWMAVALFSVAGVAQADTILVQSNDADKGLVDGGSWALSDAGFSSTGDPIAQTMYLESVTFLRDAAVVEQGTEGNLYLKVFTGSAGGLGTFVGVSNNAVDFRSLGDHEPGAWTFNNLALDKDIVYSYVVGTTNDSSNPDAQIRMRLSDGSNPLSTGGALIDDAVAWGGDYDPVVTIVASNIPEPATMSLLIAGMIAHVCARRRRKA